MKSCDLAEWLRNKRAERSRQLEHLQQIVGKGVHLYTDREASLSYAVELIFTLQKYGLLKPSKWIESTD